MSPKHAMGAIVPETPAAIAAIAPILPPALRRRFRHAKAIKTMGRNAVMLTGAFLSIAGVGVGVPAYAAVVEQEQEQQQAQQHAEAVGPTPTPQSLTVQATPESVAMPVRDQYTVYTPPALQYPVAAGTTITSGYGPRSGRLHEGVDLFPGVGTPIESIAAGIVVAVNRPSWSAMGQHVVIQHVIDGETITSTYAHMQLGSVAVSTGDYVEVGQLLGSVGETGNAQGAHLHFEIRPGGTASVDPYAWLAARI